MIRKDVFRRHSLKRVRTIECVKLAGLSVVAQYKQRARALCQNRVTVWNLGQHAGQTAAACFWLSLAAGLAECDGDVLAQALPGQHPACTSLVELRAKGLAECMTVGARRSALGLCAEALRTHFCDGPDAVLLRPGMRANIYAAFAGLAVNGPVRTEQLYRQWVQKLATREYADELVVLAAALELPIRIVVIPYTPESALAPWAITTYESPAVVGDGSRTLYLGNNDVHYVYLSRRSA